MIHVNKKKKLMRLTKEFKYFFQLNLKITRNFHSFDFFISCANFSSPDCAKRVAIKLAIKQSKIFFTTVHINRSECSNRRLKGDNNRIIRKQEKN